MPRVFDVRKGEWVEAWPVIALAAAAVFAQTLALIASDALFVSTFDLGALPRFFVMVALAKTALAIAYGAASSKKTRRGRPETHLFAIAAAVMLASIPLHDGGRVAIYATCLALQIVPTMLPLAAMNAALDLFDVRRAKRLLPIVAASATLGAVAAGLFAKIVSVGLGANVLLVAGGVVTLAGAPLPLMVASRAAARGAVSSVSAPSSRAADLRSSLRGGFTELLRSDVARVYVIGALLAAATGALADYGFKAALKARYGRDEMAAFLGTFNVVMELFVLAAQLLFTGRLVSLLGVRGALLVRPLGLVTTSALPAIAPGVGAASIVKLTDAALRSAVSGSVFDLMILPAPTETRTRARLIGKTVAAPLGALFGGGLLALFGSGGPSAMTLAALLWALALLSSIALIGAKRAYTGALSRALDEGRVALDSSPAQAALLRAELRKLLAASVAAGDEERSVTLLSLLGDRSSTLDDVVPALVKGASPAIHRAAVEAALRVAKPDDRSRILTLIPPSDDDGAERLTLAGARMLGARADRARIDRAIALGRKGLGTDAAKLWAEAQVHLALDPATKDAAIKALRKAAIGPDGPMRAAALGALGEAKDRRADAEVLRGLGSPDPEVFSAAAQASVTLGAQGAIATLISHLEAGTHVRAAVRALALAGPSATLALLAALPTTRGEGNIRTAVLKDGSVTGTVRAARVLTRLGPEACAEALGRFAQLGYRARIAVSRSLAAVPEATARAIDPGKAKAAIELTLAYAETIARAYPHARPGLLQNELRHRVEASAHSVLDLASTMIERDLVTKARAALGRDGARGNALELLENALPGGFASRVVALLELDLDALPRDRERPALDGWLEACRKLDEGELSPKDRMLSVLERLLLLRESSLFRALSGEELYSVAEIAHVVAHEPGETVVRSGDPGDALYVVASGKLRILKGDKEIGILEKGAAFGELSLLDGEPRAATIVAISDAELVRVPRAEFEALLDESPELARGVIKTLLGYLRKKS